ncbi:MAG TPA: SGNH/GDSL hydrolase family protein [Streptosporangiaceae bacterium]|nr:SGNH/GDSL hydrolase family protein [Streptosporangiaceae bacterium]
MRLPGRIIRRPRRTLSYIGVGLLVAAASIALALVITPLQDTTVAGEEIGVGAAAPTLSLSGPGEVDLFGQRLPTTLQFAGPVRPRLTLSHITLDRQLASMFEPAHGTAPARVAIGNALAAAWTRYFVWEAAITGACALLLAGALCGWARFRWRKTLVLLGIGLVLAEAADLGGIMVTAYTAPARLAQAGSLTGLVGQAPLPTVARLSGPERSKVQAVVLGDSTAAGLGNPLAAHASAQDRACRRSSDAYAADLAAVNDWDVLNLACSGATIPDGILGPQQAHRQTMPAQLAEARQAINARLVIVSIGANDVGWSGLVGLCAAAKSCADSASTAYFQQHLNTFASQYYQLLEQLATLPSHPEVLINLYYNPFDTGQHCLDSEGLSPAKENTLTTLLGTLNQVLADGATATSEVTVRPDFTGHALCDPAPYVQGVGAPAPFHPTAAGELAIALADEQALRTAQGSNPSSSPSGVGQSG